MSDGRGGWTFLKVVGVIVGLLGLVGFGVCSVCGFIVAGSDGGGDVLISALLGACAAAGFGFMVVAIFRSARKDQDREP